MRTRLLLLTSPLMLLLAGRLPGRPSDRAAAAHGREVVPITATDFAFQAPRAIPAGLATLVLHNHGLMPHHARLVRLEEGRSLRDLERHLVSTGRLPDWARDVGGVGAVEPGGSARVSLPLRSGLHVVLSAERLADGSAAVMKGMYDAIEVTEPNGTMLPPSRASVTLEILPDATPITGRLHSGRGELLVVNRTSSTLELRLYRMHDGRNERELVATLDVPRSTPVADVLGGIAGLPAGGWAILHLVVNAGDYVLVHRPSPLRGAEGPPRLRRLTVK